MLPAVRRNYQDIVNSGSRRTFLDNLFEDYCGFAGKWIWPLHIDDNKNNTVVTLDVPGYEADSLDVSISDGILTMKGEKEGRSFVQSVTVGPNINIATIEATCKDGILTVTLPKTKKKEPTKIEVK